MKFIIVALAIISLSYAQSEEDWLRFQAKYGKSYRSAVETSKRRAVWEQNWRIINQHNEEYAKGLQTNVLGENEFADLTFEEFSQLYLGVNAEKVMKDVENLPRHIIRNNELPDVVDLRQINIVPAVRNQGSCGSCWAFGAVASVEGFIARTKSVAPPDLSEQQLVDCSKGIDEDGDQSNYGCQGGWLEPTFDDIAKDGLMLESDYQYTGKNGTCKYVASKVAARISGFKSIRNQNDLLDAIAEKNLIDVAMHASLKFQLHKSGIYTPTTTENSNQVNHAVTAVGYDLLNNYLIIKNSWGTTWGELGYVRISNKGSNLPMSIGKYGTYAA